MPKNEFNKTRGVNDPYEIYRADGWEWRVLRKYWLDDTRPYARWYCAVKGPGTFGSYDLGDTYVTDVRGEKVEFDPNTLEKWREY